MDDRRRGFGRGTELGLQAGSPPLLLPKCRAAAPQATGRKWIAPDKNRAMGDSPELVGPRRIQSSSGRKMWSAVQAAQIGEADSMSPIGSGTRLSG
jgi:hypothetical protein